jgi:hypothetical protein
LAVPSNQRIKVLSQYREDIWIMSIRTRITISKM